MGSMGCILMGSMGCILAGRLGCILAGSLDCILVGSLDCILAGSMNGTWVGHTSSQVLGVLEQKDFQRKRWLSAFPHSLFDPQIHQSSEQ